MPQVQNQQLHQFVVWCFLLDGQIPLPLMRCDIQQVTSLICLYRLIKVVFVVVITFDLVSAKFEATPMNKQSDNHLETANCISFKRNVQHMCCVLDEDVGC